MVMISGNEGANTLRARDTSDEYQAGGGNDSVSGGAGNDTIATGSGDDWAEGQSGNDVMYGGPGWDTLYGGSGSDALWGHGGSDVLNGGAGQDDLIGGSDVDVFVFSNAGDANGDVIWDFEPTVDFIDLRNVDAMEARAGNQDFTWIGQEAFTAPGQLRYYHTHNNTYIAGNTEGTSGAEFTIILDGERAVLREDFLGLV